MRVLVADDETVSRRLIVSSLTRWGYDVVEASDGLEASRILLSPDAPKLAVLDWMMPGIDGQQLCRNVRRQKPDPYTYIILLTSKGQQGDIVEGLQAGADDYVTKPFDPAELKVRLRTGKRILYLQDQLINAREALRDRATRDSLTGLWNRAATFDILNDELSRTCREGASLGVILADLDHFKNVNDTFGHAVGDEVLRRVADTMRKVARRYDSVGRYGGEEFLIILPGCDESNATSHAERIRGAVGELVLETPTGAIRPTISLGVAVADGQSRTAGDILVQAADSALYCAKRNGRNCVQFGNSVEHLAEV